MALPNFAIGFNWTTVSITPQDVSAAGVLSDNAFGAASLVTSVRRVAMRQNNEVENLSAMTQRRKNNVIYESETVFTLECLLRKNDTVVFGTTTNQLGFLADGYDYIKLVVVRAAKTFTYYGLILSYEEEGTKPSGVATMELAMVDPGSANPVVS